MFSSICKSSSCCGYIICENLFKSDCWTSSKSCLLFPEILFLLEILENYLSDCCLLGSKEMPSSWFSFIVSSMQFFFIDEISMFWHSIIEDFFLSRRNFSIDSFFKILLPWKPPSFKLFCYSSILLKSKFCELFRTLLLTLKISF